MLVFLMLPVTEITHGVAVCVWLLSLSMCSGSVGPRCSVSQDSIPFYVRGIVHHVGGAHQSSAEPRVSFIKFTWSFWGGGSGCVSLWVSSPRHVGLRARTEVRHVERAVGC